METTHPQPTDPVTRRADWTIDQGWDRYSSEEHQRWTRLYDRQSALLPGRACSAFLRGLSALDLHGKGIPDFVDLSSRLKALTGWTIVAVPGLIPDLAFFEHLANRRFPAGNFIRTEAEFDYIEAPDVFHDIFGHVPMLTDPVFADYVEAFGRGGVRAHGLDCLAELARLYWYTVEFGLIEEEEGLRIYGAGIMSSPAECRFSLESDSPDRLRFDLKRVMRSLYKIDDFQQSYFTVGSFKELFDATQQDFAPIYQELLGATAYKPGTILASDIVLNHGTHRHVMDQAAS
jgi:phenylalanine-4-hydroxylase